jgi:hypothetical protein
VSVGQFVTVALFALIATLAQNTTPQTAAALSVIALMPEIDSIYSFLSEQLGVPLDKFSETSDIFQEFGVAGDDCSELVEYFSEKFSVDMSSYLWYFHHEEEGVFSLGGLFFSPPSARVDRIPVTPKFFLESANKGKWCVQYPDHQISENRYDIAINRASIILFAFIVLGIWLCTL